MAISRTGKENYRFDKMKYRIENKIPMVFLKDKDHIIKRTAIKLCMDFIEQLTPEQFQKIFHLVTYIPTDENINKFYKTMKTESDYLILQELIVLKREEVFKIEMHINYD